MTEVNSFDYHFMVVSASGKVQSKLEINTLLGTAFSVSDTVFVSAAHVARSASPESLYLARIVGKEFFWVKVVKAEFHESCDLVLLEIETALPQPKRFSWERSSFPMLTPVQIMGFPYAVEPVARDISGRSFSGYIVTTNIYQWGEIRAHSHELSFHVPRGLSGAPLLCRGKIVGMVIGNKEVEHEVFRTKDRNSKAKAPETFVEIENFRLGIAVSASDIITLESRLLGSTIGKALSNGKLLK